MACMDIAHKNTYTVYLYHHYFHVTLYSSQQKEERVFLLFHNAVLSHIFKLFTLMMLTRMMVMRDVIVTLLLWKMEQSTAK